VADGSQRGKLRAAGRFPRGNGTKRAAASLNRFAMRDACVSAARHSSRTRAARLGFAPLGKAYHKPLRAPLGSARMRIECPCTRRHDAGLKNSV